jgi:hypothetical protein
LHCHPPLNEATSAIEIDGLRPGLASVPSHVDVSVEALPPAHAALRHLWHIAALTGLTGPDRTIAVGAVTPLFDGVAVVVDALESSAEQWSISVEFAPEGASPHPFEAPTARLVSLVWWATDDRGNRYLAASGALGGNADGGRGQLRFDAPLDPRARWVELRPTTEASRAVMRIPLD